MKEDLTKIHDRDLFDLLGKRIGEAVKTIHGVLNNWKAHSNIPVWSKEIMSRLEEDALAITKSFSGCLEQVEIRSKNITSGDTLENDLRDFKVTILAAKEQLSKKETKLFCAIKIDLKNITDCASKIFEVLKEMDRRIEIKRGQK